ncbi:MAG: hypothetical protein K6T34_00725 [Thermoflavifilum sp.]|nr:hypothetical protein [Thermoflavifilum sp.]
MKACRILISTIVLMLFAFPVVSQTTFTDGKIYYKIQVDAGNGNQELSNSLKGSTYTLYVKGKYRRIDMDLKMMKQQIYINTQDSTYTFLIETMGNKYMMKLTAAQLRTQQDPYRVVQYTDAPGTKVIAGYTCKLAIAHTADGSTFPVYYTPQLIPDGDYSTDLKISQLKGFPLEFQRTINHINMTITAEKVDLSPVPMSAFDIPASGYREINPDELMHP